MYVVAIPNRTSPPAILLRESYRDGARVKNRTLANLSAWAPERVEALRQILRGQPVSAARLEGAFEILRSRPHGHVAAVLGTCRRLDLDGLLAPRPERRRQLVLAMIVDRLLDPRSKLIWKDRPSSDFLRRPRSLGRCRHPRIPRIGMDDFPSGPAPG
ncbi:MAG TPA: hypothetical protein VHQ03_09005 [Candidatus Dormibacteraeota bacterium]|nr:hypothetical protein [Candidatus Dormibacteraeota bacterium]